MSKALFAGSFDPFTIGHKSVADRGLELFDRLIIAIGDNVQKRAWQPIEERLAAIRRVYAAEPRVEVVSYQGLTFEAAREHGANVLLRGVRSVADFEYERTLADVNRKLAGLETVLIYALPEMESVSSSMVRELASFNYDISQYIPK